MTESPTPFRLELLGVPILRGPDGLREKLSRGKPLALLSYLTTERRPVTREELGELLWPDSPPERQRHSVRQAIWILRRSLGEDMIQGEDPVSVPEEAVRSDLEEFEEALASEDVDRARYLWRGPPLSRFALPESRGWERWRDGQQETLARRLFDALVNRARGLLRKDDPGAALEYLEEAVDLRPFSPEGRVLHVEALLDLGRFATARQALDEAVQELGDAELLPLELRRLTEDVRHLQSLWTESGPSTPDSGSVFVGRKKELSDLLLLWRKARGGDSRIAHLTGPAGIGKSSLARAFLATLGREEDAVAVALARGFRGERDLPLGTVTDLIAELLSLPGAKGISPGSDAVLRAMVPSLKGEGSREGIFPRFLDVGRVHPAALADAFTDLVGAVGFEAPLVMVLEDWQWVDAQSRSLLGKVARRTRDLPCLILITQRTGGSGSRAEDLPIPAEDSRHPTLVLDRLIEEDLASFLESRWEAAHPETCRQLAGEIYSLTDGSPLLVREVFEQLMRSGARGRDEGPGALDVARVRSRMVLPDSVKTVFRERFARLGPPAERLAASLADEEKPCTIPVLRAETHLGEADFAQALWTLLQRQIVTWAEDGRVEFASHHLRTVARLTLNQGGEESRPESFGSIGPTEAEA